MTSVGVRSIRMEAVVDRRFRIERLHATGGMGEVYLATDHETSGAVAIKVLRCSSPHWRARFAREAAVLADLSHPGIVRYLAHGETASGEPYIAMEWIEGDPLS